MAAYLITDIPAEQMKHFKMACVYFKEPMRAVLIRLMDVQIAAYEVDIGRAKIQQKQSKKKG